MTDPLDDKLSNVLRWPRNYQPDSDQPTSTTGGGDGTYDGMDPIAALDTRMKVVETSVEGLRHSQNLTLGVIGFAVTLAIFGGSYLLSRVDALATDVGGLPDRINTNLLELNRTLSDSITAARSSSGSEPIVIVVPSQGQSTAPAPASTVE